MIKEDERAHERDTHNERYRDAFRGCLIGGAAGDALGYPVEFMRYGAIIAQYGVPGITAYEKAKSGLALFSDDTQTTLFTATGLLTGATRGLTRGIMASLAYYVGLSYTTWYRMQCGKLGVDKEQDVASYSWLCDVPEMGARRAPGTTCMSAIGSGRYGTAQEPVNDSKGCGGVMRVAPVGLYLARDDDAKAIENMDRVAEDVAALTHGHELGYMSAVALAHIVNRIVYAAMSVAEAAADALSALRRLYEDKQHLKELTDLMELALMLAQNDQADVDNIKRLGGGWVGDEALAIALYCAVKYENDFSAALIAAVNHSGDSDSTGAIAGNILGARWGYARIPAQWKQGLECADVLLEVADDLLCDGPLSQGGHDGNDPAWVCKYMENRRYVPARA